MDDDPELLWAILLAEGKERLSEEERVPLAMWLMGNLPGRRAELMPETAGESEKLRLLAEEFLRRDMAELAAPMAKMALEASERFCAPGDAAVGAALTTAAHALRLCLARDEVMPAEETEALAGRLRCHAVDHGDGSPYAAALLLYGEAMTALRLYDEAEPALRRLLDLVRRIYPDHAYSNALAQLDLAIVLAAKGSYGEAEPLFQGARSLFARLDAPSQSDLWDSAQGHGICLTHLGRYDEAEQALLSALTRGEAEFGRTSDEATQARRWLSLLRRSRFLDRTENRPFGWALDSALPADGFQRAVDALLIVARELGGTEEAGKLILDAARLSIHGGEAEAARLILREGLERAAEGGQAVLRRLQEALAGLDHPGMSTLLEGLLPEEDWDGVLEADVEACVSLHDLARLQDCFPAYLATAKPDPQIVADGGWVAAHLGDRELAMRAIERLERSAFPAPTLGIWLEMGEFAAAEALVRRLPAGSSRGTALAERARHCAEAGDRPGFETFAAQALGEAPEERSVALHLGWAARALMGADGAESWGRARLGETALKEFLPPLRDAPVSRFAQRPELAEAVRKGHWERAVDLLSPLHDDMALGVTISKIDGQPVLRRVPRAYVDYRLSLSLAEAAAAARRMDIALAALTFALSTLGDLASPRQLGICARDLLPAGERRRFVEVAFASAAERRDLAEAADLVVAAGHACVPSKVEQEDAGGD